MDVATKRWKPDNLLTPTGSFLKKTAYVAVSENSRMNIVLYNIDET